jgi:hypothetical protein
MPKVLSPFKYIRQDDRKYRFCLTEPLLLYFPDDNFGWHNFADKNGKVWAVVRGNSWKISSGYAWDGSSPKIRIAKVWLGTPDFDSTLIASLWHDCSGQFRHLKCLNEKLTWGRWNKLFKDLITNKVIGCTYHAGLIIGNIPFSLIGKLFNHKPTCVCTIHKNK